MERDSFFRRLLEMVAEKHSISMHVPVEKLTEGKINTLLYGTGDEKYKITYYSSQDGSERTIFSKYEGIIPNLERRYRETQSDFIRNEIEKYMTTVVCPKCTGSRLKPVALAVTVDNENIANMGGKTIQDFYDKIQSLTQKLVGKEKIIAEGILREISVRSKFLLDVGLDYLTVNRAASTLSGGEAQRIRLASQIGTGLSGVIYVLDEPSIGLHARDQHRLINTLKNLRDLGNTVLVVEHDKDTMVHADMLVDFGPGAGRLGGEVVAAGSPVDVMENPNSVTGPYLSGKVSVKKNVKKMIEKVRKEKSRPMAGNNEKKGYLEIAGAKTHNLKDISVKFPLGKFICVTGVSGSGKSSLVVETLLPALKRTFGQRVDSTDTVYRNLFVNGAVDKVLYIDQSPIGRTPRSNPATYTKVFDDIRELFAQTKDAKIKGYTPSRFSFNLKGGRCEACKGEGKIKIEMQFMPDVYIDCDVCHGNRYVSEVLQVRFKEKNIADVLNMPVGEALDFFKEVPTIREKLQMVDQVGLSYITLGQSAPLLSGGEAQRVKLAAELSKRATGKTIYILDEPTTGLHFVDIEKLIVVLRTLVDNGNTVIVIEHNLDFIMEADWLIDIGPEGGEKGGQVMYEGNVENIMKTDTWTGKMLKEYQE
jgi:excinuclease ABC subunit A